MRDHPQHDVAILGGMWGIKLTDETRLLIKQAFDRMFLTSTNLLGSRTQPQHDQIVLKNYVWPVVKNRSMVHDAYFCQKWEGSVPFPSQRVDELRNFVGAPYEMRLPFTKAFHCPQACRPNDHQDWTYC